MNPRKLLIIVALLILAGGGYYLLQQNRNQSLSKGAQDDVNKIAEALQQYKLHNFVYPTNEQGLAALITAPADARMWRGPYIDRKEFVDAWGHPLVYETTDDHGFRILSPGPDGTPSTPDDLVYTNTP